MKRSRHPNKEIEAALQEAEQQGWVVETNRGHWGIMKCPTNAECRGGLYCSFPISGSPRNPQTHAKQIRKAISKCDSEQSD